MLRRDGDWLFFTIQCNHERKGIWVHCTSDSFSETEVCGTNQKYKDAWREWTACGNCWQLIGEHGFFSSYHAAVIGDALKNKYPQHEFRVMKMNIKQKASVIYGEVEMNKEVREKMEKEISVLCTTCVHGGLCKYEDEMSLLVVEAETVSNKLSTDSPLELKTGCKKWLNKSSSTPRF